MPPVGDLAELARSDPLAVLDRAQIWKALGRERLPQRREGPRKGPRAGRVGPPLHVALSSERWAGVDEAGRGPLAGPVVACACVLPPGLEVPGLQDSKALTPPARERLFPVLMAQALDVRIAVVSHHLIDRLNVWQASLLAMSRAASALSVLYDRLVVDGPWTLPLNRPGAVQEPLVGADARIACVAAASVIAKVFRDALMDELDAIYPGYGFAHNKGYPTPEHLAALRARGPSPVHRLSFAPVAEASGPAPA